MLTTCSRRWWELFGLWTMTSAGALVLFAHKNLLSKDLLHLLIHSAKVGELIELYFPKHGTIYQAPRSLLRSYNESVSKFTHQSVFQYCALLYQRSRSPSITINHYEAS